MSSSKSVLIIEDDQSIRETLVTILESEGFHTQAASNGREALKLLNKLPSPPHLILLDIMMPVMNGYEFREEQLQHKVIAQIPTIVLSADRSFHQQNLNLGFKQVLKKPIDLEELLSVVNSI